MILLCLTINFLKYSNSLVLLLNKINIGKKGIIYFGMKCDSIDLLILRIDFNRLAIS